MDLFSLSSPEYRSEGVSLIQGGTVFVKGASHFRGLTASVPIPTAWKKGTWKKGTDLFIWLVQKINLSPFLPQLGIGAKWFWGAEAVSRAPLNGLGADGNASYITFGLGWLLAPVYSWRTAAGDALINGGFDNFEGPIQ